MHKLKKLIILILLSCSVYFIYQNTKNSVFNITNIGDNLAIGVNPYGIKESGYIECIKDYINAQNKSVYIENNFNKKDLTINILLEQVKNNPNIKKTLSESNLLILAIGYNDLLYKLSLKEKINMKNLNEVINEISDDYNDMIKEIRRFYKRDIIVIGYYCSNKESYYLNKGIRKLNETLSNSKEVTYIDTYNLLSNREKYFPNPHLNYPNNIGYQEIAKKIITKTLEKK